MKKIPNDLLLEKLSNDPVEYERIKRKRNKMHKTIRGVRGGSKSKRNVEWKCCQLTPC